ncbi:hypothetical protein [Actinomadura sp. DC4]|uniref:hypothetical protein n=1 Tax=Actinomadura sp. DC4 TaxID=3055069 RepID=UPI0025B07B2E|nr:hypothetical protein [Actinomadura sp. DC4]MDN3351865.1 hypothetical protein [Actinomadura sp. DC4]
MSTKTPPALLTTRTAVVLLLAAACGAAVAGLTWLARHEAAETGLAGLAAFAGAVGFFHRHLDAP